MEDRARILVVEPNKTNLGVLARRLSAEGFRVATADSGSAAFAELHRLPIDLVLAELNMQAMSGADLARLIRGAIQWRDLPIMLITGRSAPKGAVLGYEAGADDVILKPFHFEVLVARIERRIARLRAVEQLVQDNAALDARVVKRALQIGELKEQLAEAQAKART